MKKRQLTKRKVYTLDSHSRRHRHRSLKGSGNKQAVDLVKVVWGSGKFTESGKCIGTNKVIQSERGSGKFAATYQQITN